MIDDVTLGRLRAFHDEILARIVESSNTVRVEGALSQSTLAARRWRMVRLLREYQVFKHLKIFDPAIARGSPRQMAAARAMKIQCIAASESFTAYVRHWSSGLIADEWDGYRTAMLAMSAFLTRHVKDERRAIESALSDREDLSGR